MHTLPRTVLQPAGGSRRRRLRVAAGDGSWRLVLVVGAAAVLGGIVMGVLWWLLAPTAVAQVQGGQVLLEGHQELQVSQDGWFAVVTGASGVLLGTGLALRPGRRPALLAVVGAVGLAVAAVVGWRVGMLLGPEPLLEQVRAGDRTPVTPLALHTPAPLILVGPLMFSLTRFVAALLIGDQGAGARAR